MTLLIMAAGRGSRYGALKQFDGLGPQGAFLLEYSIFDAIQVGFKQIVLITQAAKVSFLETYLETRLPKQIAYTVLAQEISDLPKNMQAPKERQKPWGTAHAVWTARHYIQEGFVVLNADDFYGKEAFKSAAQFLKGPTSKHNFGLLSYPLDRTLSDHGAVSRGICHIKNDFLVAIEERTQIAKEGNLIRDLESKVTYSGKEPVSMNFWICQPSFFDAVSEQLQHFIQEEEALLSKELYIPQVIATMIKENKIPVVCVPSNSEWFGVTYAADRATVVSKLSQMTQGNSYPTPLWKKMEGA